MVPLNRDSGRNSGRFSFVERGNGSWSPVVYAAGLTTKAAPKEIAILAEIVQQTRKSGFIAGPEDGGVSRGAFPDGRQMFSQWFSVT
jgi:hypothetical protein